MTYTPPGRAWNGDMFFDLEDALNCLGYLNREEAVKNYCHNTPSAFLREGRINECDLCQLLTNAPDPYSAEVFERYLIEETLKRPLDPKPLHDDREELERQVREARDRRRAERRRQIESGLRPATVFDWPLTDEESHQQPDIYGYFYPDDGGEPELVRVSLYNGY